MRDIMRVYEIYTDLQARRLLGGDDCILCDVLFFFFSSRRRHTRLQGDWSSDVCSSDLPTCWRVPPRARNSYGTLLNTRWKRTRPALSLTLKKCPTRARRTSAPSSAGWRSEERRVGKRGDLGGRRIIKKKKKRRTRGRRD